jgi:transcriptional regulator with XRE-family HTH domain
MTQEFKIPKPLDIEVLAVKAQKSMAQVCREAGVSAANFSHWKHGRTALTVATIEKLLAVVQPEAS